MYTIARNNRTNTFEVHKAGCAHVTSPRMMDAWNPVLIAAGTYEAADAKDAKAQFEASNDGCYVGKISPCSKEV